jgi:hypothetical protein
VDDAAVGVRREPEDLVDVVVVADSVLVNRQYR